jgi:hypothetical protein
MITDSSVDTSYAALGGSDAFGNGVEYADTAGSLDAVALTAVAPAPYSEEFGGGGSPFDQQAVSDPSFQPQLADTPNPTSTDPNVLVLFAIGLAFLAMWGKE